MTVTKPMYNDPRTVTFDTERHLYFAPVDGYHVRHLTQPCPISCMATCLAMITGRPLRIMVDLYHDALHERRITLRDALNLEGVAFESRYSIDEQGINYIGVYLVTVPSLNIPGCNHQIVVEMTNDSYQVFDPVRGREGRKYYVNQGCEDDGGLQYPLGSFIVDAFIRPEWYEWRSTLATVTL